MTRILQQKKGESDNVSFPPCLLHLPRSISSISRKDKRQTHSFPVLVIRDLCGVACYPPAPVGCCTTGLDGLVESVLVVVVDAAPSSRAKAMIHAIMGASSCLALLFPPNGRSMNTKKSVLMMWAADSELTGLNSRVDAMGRRSLLFLN